ncbi:MAG: glycosyltransferase family 4 protein [Bryobacteraceae bacterium]|jgi:glycosyltransferase involved in cell wall biosynthesis
MRILHLDSGRGLRGGQWQALRLHRGLIAAGHESMLLAREGSPLLDAARERKLPCEVLRPWRLPMQSRRFDIVHAHDARSHTWGALLARAPLVVSRRVAFPVRDSAVSRWKYGRPVFFIAVSRFVAQELRRAGVEERRITVVYDGVPVPPQPARGEAILVPWTADPEKGMALAERAAARAGITLQRSTNLEADLPGARAMVYISRSEGLGSGILLGMAYGVTVIASNVGGIPELIEDGATGILVPNDMETIAGAFERIHAELGMAARRTVVEKFTEDRMVKATLAAYEGVFARA